MTVRLAETPTAAPPAERPVGPTYRQSLASRILLLVAAAVGIAVAAAALAVYATVRIQMQTSLDESLVSRAEAAVRSDALPQVTSGAPVPAWALGIGDIRIAFVISDGGLVRADGAPGVPQLGEPERMVALGRSELSVRTLPADDGSLFRVVAVPAVPPVAGRPGYALVLAQSLGPAQDVLDRLGVVLFIVGIVGMIIGGLAGWGVAKNSMMPVRRLTGAAEQVARTDRLDPIAVEGEDEIARLAMSFNQMLAALAASRDRQRRLIADAGHELRTPLTSLRTNLDLLTQLDRSLADGQGADGRIDERQARMRAELLDDVRFQMAELTTLVGDLVELAREEPLQPILEEVDLADVVDRAVARVRRRAPGVVFDVDVDTWPLEGESSALERAVTNLLDNAAKWSPEGGTVTVRGHDGELVVDDQGPGISEADLPHVFERFWRASESRTMPGSGLGLSIVQQAVERHGGGVAALLNEEGGARFVVRLPYTPAEAEAAPEGDEAAEHARRRPVLTRSTRRSK